MQYSHLMHMSSTVNVENDVIKGPVLLLVSRLVNQMCLDKYFGKTLFLQQTIAGIIKQRYFWRKILEGCF